MDQVTFFSTFSSYFFFFFSFAGFLFFFFENDYLTNMKQEYNLAIKQIRVYLIEKEKINLEKHSRLIEIFAQKKYGIKFFKSKKVAQNWLTKLAISGAFKGWPIKTAFEKENRKKSRNRRREYMSYINSPEWNKIRQAVLKRDGYKCTKCGTDNFILHVHHLTYDHFAQEENYLSDLITLCEICHNAIHRRRHRKKAA